MRAEITVVEVLNEMYRIYIALLTANDHVGQVALVYILATLCQLSQRPLRNPFLYASTNPEISAAGVLAPEVPAPDLSATVVSTVLAKPATPAVYSRHFFK